MSQIIKLKKLNSIILANKYIISSEIQPFRNTQYIFYSTLFNDKKKNVFNIDDIDHLKIPTQLPKPPHTDPRPMEPKDMNPQAPRPPREQNPSPFPRPQRKEVPDSRPEDGYPNPIPI